MLLGLSFLCQMKIENTFIAASLLAVIAFSACTSGISVTYDSDKKANWSAFRTFNIKHPDLQELEKMKVDWMDKMPLIEQNITNQMQQRGYVRAEEPDLWLTYFIEVEDKQKAYSTGTYVTMGGYYTPFRYTVGSNNVNVVDYKEGTLYVDIVDASTNQQIWHGAGSKTLAETPISSKQDAAISQAIQYIFYRFKYKSPDFQKK